MTTNTPEKLHPSIYTAKSTGNTSIKLGSGFHQPAAWRKLVEAIMDDKIRAELLGLCSELEKES